MDKRAKVYEVGFLLLPTIPEEHLTTEVENIKSVIAQHEGQFITEDFPKLRPLAYAMTKHTTGSNQKFDTAYFGWVKFEAAPGVIPMVKETLDKNANILRFMIISTVRENTMFTQKAIFRPSEDAVAEKEGGEKMSEEEMEKTIENLVVE